MQILEKTETKMFRYAFGDYNVDIVKPHTGHRGVYEAWIGRDDIGIATLMFGLMASSMKEFIEIVEANLLEHIVMFEEKYPHNEGGDNSDAV